MARSVKLSLEDSRLRDADRLYRRADDDAIKAVKKALPPGRWVQWSHGNHIRSGVVEEVLGFSYHNCDLWVISDASGKRVRVSAFSIMRGMGIIT